MRLVMGLSTLVVAAVAVLWLAMRPVEAPKRPAPGATGGEPARSAAPAPADEPAPEAAAPEAVEEAPEPAEAQVEPPPEPPRHRLVAPRATPLPRPVQAIPTPTAIPPPPVDPPPTRVAVQNAVRSAKPLVGDCYAQALEHSPDLGGTLKVSFTVTPDDEGVGRIRDAEVLDEGLRQPFLEMCVLEALGTAEYPVPEGADGELKVTYPFVLRPAD